LTEDLRVGLNARTIGIESRQHRIAAWSAQWKRTVCSVENDSPRRQAINVGRLSQRIPVAAKQIVQVVGDDEQNIGTSGIFSKQSSGTQKNKGTEQQVLEH
jgi:hypothetical protein